MKISAFFLGCLFLACGSVTAQTLRLPADQDNLARGTAAAILHGEYDRAWELSQKLRAVHSGAGCVLSAMVRVSRFDDLGDTAALRRAETDLDSCTTEGLWEALRLFELGYVHSILGNHMKAAFKTRGAARHFKQSPDTDAQAFYAIYAYYVDQLTAGISWMPFVSDRRIEHLESLRKGAAGTSIYWPLFATSLVWMHYDRKEYEQGLLLTQNMLSRSPGNPVFTQIRADMLFALGRYEDAADEYLGSAAHYLKRTGKSLRYWCAVANLARIYQAMGDPENAALWAEQLREPEFLRLARWMPGSLMDDLKKRKLVD